MKIYDNSTEVNKANSTMKLVRDKIPSIIAQQGKECLFRKANPKEFPDLLLKKLKEETTEFVQSGDAEEMADILEVLYAIAREKGITPERLEELRKNKADKRGVFTKRIILL